MSDFEIYADSSANLTAELAKTRNIHIISYIFTVDGKDEYCYDENIPFRETAKRFYERMREGLEAKTSLISEARFVEEISPALEAGKDAVVLTIASGISGTYNQALNAKRTLEEKFPGRTVYVCDSANASLGEGLLALRAADLRDLGESAEACARWLRKNAYSLNSYVTVEDLKYLRRGGRISAVTAIAGTILNIKPLIRADGGATPKLAVYDKARGRKKAISALVDAFVKYAKDPENQTIAIAHADCEEEALGLAETLREHGAKDILIEYYDLCSGSHIGPGTLALFFMGPDRRSEADIREAEAREQALVSAKKGKTAKQTT